MSWQDDKPWAERDREIQEGKDRQERADNNQKSFKFSLNPLITWFKNLFKR